MKTLVNVIQGTNDLTARYATRDTDGKRVIKVYGFSEARAAVVMPVSEYPGYFLVMGREIFPNPTGRNALRFMMEGREVLHDVLFEKLTAATLKCRAMILYAKQERTTRGMEGSFRELWQYIRKNRIAGVRLMAAPSSWDPEYGKTIIREYIKAAALFVPEKTILREQLKSMAAGYEAGDDLYAFHALRYLAAGFSKSKHMPLPAIENKPKLIDRRDAGGWT